jgi:hypothetical protein
MHKNLPMTAFGRFFFFVVFFLMGFNRGIFVHTGKEGTTSSIRGDYISMKLFGWLSKLLISTVLISTLSVLTTGFVVNLYVEEIFRQYQLPGLGKKVQFSDIAARLSEELNISKPKGGMAASSNGNQSATSESSSGLDAGRNATTNSGKNSNLNPPAPANSPSSPSPAPANQANPSKPTEAAPDSSKDDAVAVWGQVQQESGSSETKAQKDMVISTEEFAKKKDLLTSEDKMKIFSLVVNKLPQDEVQHLSAILEDGITAVEMKEVDQILQKYLSKEEYKQLFDILNKY